MAVYILMCADEIVKLPFVYPRYKKIQKVSAAQQSDTGRVRMTNRFCAPLKYDTHPKWIHLSVSEAKEVTDGDEPKSKAQCYIEMRNAAQAEFDAGCDLPTVTLKVNFVNCSDVEEYKQ